jgi:hypothetical protein
LAHRRFRWSGYALGDASQHVAQPDEAVWDEATAF